MSAGGRFVLACWNGYRDDSRSVIWALLASFQPLNQCEFSSCTSGRSCLIVLRSFSGSEASGVPFVLELMRVTMRCLFKRDEEKEQNLILT